MFESIIGGALFGVAMGMLVYLLIGAALSLAISRWLAASSISVRDAFLVENSNVDAVAAKWAMPFACGVLGAIAAAF